MIDKKKIVRVYVVYISMLVFALAVFARIVYLQAFASGNMREKVEESTVSLHMLDAPRGTIFADNEHKTALALSVPRYDIYMDPVTVDEDVFNENVIALADSLSWLFKDRSPFDWEQSLRGARSTGNRYYPIKKNINHLQLQEIRDFPIFQLGQNKGGFIKLPKTKRVKPYEHLAKRTIGYAKHAEVLGQKDYLVGLEGAFDEYLEGQDGEMLMERIGGNGWKPIPSDVNVEPIPGSDIYTSIDINIQDVAESALMKQMVEQNAQKGCAVLMEVETGYIKAIANLTRDTSNGTYHEWFNHAVGMASEPGSTFKLASLMVMLDDGKVRITDSVDMPGKYCFYETCLHDSKHGGYGKGTIQRAFEVSSNVFSEIVNANYDSNPQEYISGLKSIGLDKQLGLKISGEGKPFVKDADHPTFSGITLPWMAIGYEVQQTPLQTLTLYNAVANNGIMVKPQFVKEVRNGTEVVEVFEPEVLNPMVCSYSTLIDVRKCLEGVVERGTAKNIKARGFAIAGKTGTAKIAENGSYSNKYQASFVGYFPADAPKYSCVVVIQGPTKQIYGSQVSGTVFKEIADKVYASGYEQAQEKEQVLANLSYPYSKNGAKQELMSVFKAFGVPVKDEADVSSYVVTNTNDQFVKMGSKKVSGDKVANVVGMGLVDALFILESQGLTVKINGSGVVKNQSLNPGTQLEKGKLIVLDLI